MVEKTMRLASHGSGVQTCYYADGGVFIRHACLEKRDTNWQMLLKGEYTFNPENGAITLLEEILCGLCTLRGTIVDGSWIQKDYPSVMKKLWK